MSVCTNTGSLPESGAQITVDWMDGTSDSMLVFSAPNSQNCYVFEHDYFQAGIYNALVNVTSGTAGGTLAGSTTIEWIITNTNACGYFNVFTLSNSSGNFLPNVPYDITDNTGSLTTVYPHDSFGNPFYTELDISAAPFTVSVSSDWLQIHSYTQVSPNFVINSFDQSGLALGVPMNMTVACLGNGIVPDLELRSSAAFQFLAPVQSGNVSVQVCNVSCGNSANSEIKIALPAGITPNLSNVPNATFQNDTVTITAPYLSDCATYSFPCTFAGNTPAGTIFNFSASVQAQGELNFQFNQSDFSTTVLNSYDPNDKQCHKPTILMPYEQETLEYTVRFQNDGNYPALNVVIRDTIAPQLNLSTFRLIQSKHPLSYTIDPSTREIVFRFSGIQLQPSAANLDASQGYVTYSLKENTNLPLNSVIENTAYIYFDFNPAIITNTTYNINGFVGTTALTLEEISMYPNPSSGQLYFKSLANSEAQTIEITDLSGRVCERLPFSTQLQLKLEPGQYLLSVKSPTSVLFFQKLVVQ
jgi:uncharacterized repeat protein (TIGR01451 family)